MLRLPMPAESPDCDKQDGDDAQNERGFAEDECYRRIIGKYRSVRTVNVSVFELSKNIDRWNMPSGNGVTGQQSFICMICSSMTELLAVGNVIDTLAGMILVI